MTINEIIKTTGSSFYVFGTAELKKRIAFLRASLPSRVRLCYAVKANTFIVKELLNEVDRFEICSPGESRICGRLGVMPEKTVISGLYKDPRNIEELVGGNGERVYTAESASQLVLLSSLAKKYGKHIKVLLRITNDSQFGMDEADALAALTDENFALLDFCGLQFFSGTQKTSIKKARRELTMMHTVFCKARDIYGEKMRTLEYGTGFPVAYFADEAFDESDFFSQFSQLLSELDDIPEITLEIGRSIAASCGSYYTRIEDIKRNKGLNYAITNGGMHQMVYFGQQMAMRTPVFEVYGKENEPPANKYNICGALCSMNDIILKNASLPAVKPGDVICFHNTGAYCPTEGISLFLSRELPAVYLWDGQNAVCVRKAFETSPLNTPGEII